MISSKTRLTWRVGYLVASLGVYLMDQASKAWVVRRVRFEDRTIIRGALDFVYAENRGIAFGQLQEGGQFGRWFFCRVGRRRRDRGAVLFHPHAA